MSANERRRSSPESHLIERHLADAPAHAWQGRVRITGEQGTMVIPGVWHLELPPFEQLPPHRHRSPRHTVPLPPANDHAAWRTHLVRMLTLQMPGVTLRVQTATGTQWDSLEIAAPTAPPSVVHIDRAGLQSLLGGDATVELRVGETDTAPPTTERQ